jgi:hypothetical protein
MRQTTLAMRLCRRTMRQRTLAMRLCRLAMRHAPLAMRLPRRAMRQATVAMRLCRLAMRLCRLAMRQATFAVRICRRRARLSLRRGGPPCETSALSSATIVPLLIEARGVLGVSQGALGVMLGSSERSGQRWERGGAAAPTSEQLHDLARLVHPHDAALAARIATAAGTSLLALGVVAPPPPALPARPPVDPAHLVDAIVCAAADAMQVVPDAVRPALRAAFQRARLVGLAVEDVDDALRVKPAAPAPAGPKKPPKGATS